jgi:ABC-2 type transport system permease protein
MLQNTLLVAEREITTQIRSKAFIISTVIMLVVILAGIVLSSVFGDKLGSDTKVAVVSGTAAIVADLDGIEPVDAADEDAARQMVEDEDVSAALLPDTDADNPLGVVVIGKESAPDTLVSALAVTPPVELLDEPTTSAGLRYVIALAFGLVFMFASLSFGSTIAQNTVQEKQSRIVEILLSAVPPRALLAGKVIGNSVLALGQTAAIAAASVIGLAVTGQDGVLSLVGAPVAWFVLFFLVGFVLIAAMFAAAASLVSR